MPVSKRIPSKYSEVLFFLVGFGISFLTSGNLVPDMDSFLILAPEQSLSGLSFDFRQLAFLPILVVQFDDWFRRYGAVRPVMMRLASANFLSFLVF